MSQLQWVELYTDKGYPKLLRALEWRAETTREEVTPQEIASKELGDAAEKPSTMELDFRACVAGYRINRLNVVGRVEVDKRLARGVGRLPTSMLEALFYESLNDPETTMAIAVSLGVPLPSDDDTRVVRLLTELLGSGFERTCFRAARSARLRAEQDTLDAYAKTRLLKAAKAAKEHHSDSQPVVEELEETISALKRSL